MQVGDPFMEKLLIEACLELFQTDAVVGHPGHGRRGPHVVVVRDGGTRRQRARARPLDRSRVRETGMTPYEILLSESQERMLLVARRDRLDEVLAICQKWELDAVEIGRVTDSGASSSSSTARSSRTFRPRRSRTARRVYDRPRAALVARRRRRSAGTTSPSPRTTRDCLQAPARLAERRARSPGSGRSTTTWSRPIRSSARAATPR